MIGKKYCLPLKCFPVVGKRFKTFFIVLCNNFVSLLRIFIGKILNTLKHGEYIVMDLMYLSPSFNS